jgi:hypothetical protein
MLLVFLLLLLEGDNNIITSIPKVLSEDSIASKDSMTKVIMNLGLRGWPSRDFCRLFKNAVTLHD